MPPTANKKAVSAAKSKPAKARLSSNRRQQQQVANLNDEAEAPRKQNSSSSEADSDSVSSDGATNCDSVQEDIVAMLNKGSAQLMAVSCISSRSRHRDI